MLNIANEWGRKGAVSNEQFRDAYKRAISIIRNAGIKSTLIIDSNQWAQDFAPVQRYGKELVNHDPLKNVGFSNHYYCEILYESQINSELDWAVNNDVLLMIGEFAQEHRDYARGGVCDINERAIVRMAQENKQGYYWWAWKTSQGHSLSNNWEASGRDALTGNGRWLIYDDPNVVHPQFMFQN